MVKESHLSVAHRVSSGSRAQRGKAVHEESRSVSHGRERWQAESRSELVSNLFTLEEHRLHACFQILQRHQGEGPRAVECRKSVQVSEQSEEVHARNENAVRRCVPRTDVTLEKRLYKLFKFERLSLDCPQRPNFKVRRRGGLYGVKYPPIFKYKFGTFLRR